MQQFLDTSRGSRMDTEHFYIRRNILTLLLLNSTCPVLANSVDPDQLASEEAN